MNLLLKRIIAFLFDYLLILIYASLLAATSFGLSESLNFELGTGNPLKGQIIGFFSLTLPVFLYFYLNEKRSGSTLGKKWQKIKVVTDKKHGMLKRNLFKFLPWELAHTGVHWVVYFGMEGIETPIWVWALLILPQLTVLIYIVSLISNKGKKVLYDLWAKTTVIQSKSS